MITMTTPSAAALRKLTVSDVLYTPIHGGIFFKELADNRSIEYLEIECVEFCARLV